VLADDDKSSLKRAWSDRVNHLNFGGHQPYICGTAEATVVQKEMCSGSRDLFKFWEISDNVLKMVQHRGKVAKKV